MRMSFSSIGIREHRLAGYGPEMQRNCPACDYLAGVSQRVPNINNYRANPQYSSFTFGNALTPGRVWHNYVNAPTWQTGYYNQYASPALCVQQNCGFVIGGIEPDLRSGRRRRLHSSYDPCGPRGYFGRPSPRLHPGSLPQSSVPYEPRTRNRGGSGFVPVEMTRNGPYNCITYQNQYVLRDNYSPPDIGGGSRRRGRGARYAGASDVAPVSYAPSNTSNVPASTRPPETMPTPRPRESTPPPVATPEEISLANKTFDEFRKLNEVAKKAMKDLDDAVPVTSATNALRLPLTQDQVDAKLPLLEAAIKAAEPATKSMLALSNMRGLRGASALLTQFQTLQAELSAANRRCLEMKIVIFRHNLGVIEAEIKTLPLVGRNPEQEKKFKELQEGRKNTLDAIELRETLLKRLEEQGKRLASIR